MSMKEKEVKLFRNRKCLKEGKKRGKSIKDMNNLETTF